MKQYLIIFVYCAQVALFFGLEPIAFIFLMSLVFEFVFIFLAWSVLKLKSPNASPSDWLTFPMALSVTVVFYVLAALAGSHYGDFPNSNETFNLITGPAALYGNLLFVNALFVGSAVFKGIRDVSPQLRLRYARYESYRLTYIVLVLCSLTLLLIAIGVSIGLNKALILSIAALIRIVVEFLEKKYDPKRHG